jgi:hypothetical protein
MTKEEHRKIHIELHNSLDLLFADYILHHPDQNNFLGMQFQQLMEWSYSQTINPDPAPGTKHTME